MKFTVDEAIKVAKDLAKNAEIIDNPAIGLIEEGISEAKNRITKDILDLIKTMGQDGNWNYDEYNFGLSNGLVVAYATITGKEPIFFNKPPVWLKDIERKEFGSRMHDAFNKEYEQVSPPEHPDNFFFNEAMKVLKEQ